MPVAIIEIASPATARSGTKKDGTQWGPYWSQEAHVHGQNGAYPRSITIDLKNASEQKAAGFYLIDGTAIAMTNPTQGFPAPGLRLGDLNALIPLGEGVHQITKFMDAREQAAA